MVDKKIMNNIQREVPVAADWIRTLRFGFVAPGSLTDEQYRRVLADRKRLGLCLMCSEVLTATRMAGLCSSCVAREWT